MAEFKVNGQDLPMDNERLATLARWRSMRRGARSGRGGGLGRRAFSTLPARLSAGWGWPGAAARWCAEGAGDADSAARGLRGRGRSGSRRRLLRGAHASTSFRGPIAQLGPAVPARDGGYGASAHGERRRLRGGARERSRSVSSCKRHVVDVVPGPPPLESPAAVSPMSTILYELTTEYAGGLRGLSVEGELLKDPLYYLACEYELAYYVLWPQLSESTPLHRTILWVVRTSGGAGPSSTIATTPLVGGSQRMGCSASMLLPRSVLEGAPPSQLAALRAVRPARPRLPPRSRARRCHPSPSCRAAHRGLAHGQCAAGYSPSCAPAPAATS